MPVPQWVPPQRVQDDPPSYLAAVGCIVARFDQQDSGNLCYGLDIGGHRYFVKTAGDPDAAGPGIPHAERVGLLDNAIRIAGHYQHPALPALRHVIGSPYGPMLFYDWVDGELLWTPAAQRDEPNSAHQRFRALPVERILAVLDTIADVHGLLGDGGEVGNDFYDGCLLYDFGAGHTWLVDLDHYRPGPYRNELGRMFGSTRFMAPEEHVLGALIDQRTTVFTLGRTVLVLLGDGTGDPAAFRGPSVVLEVAARACQPDPARRFGSVRAFAAAWRRARATG